MRLLCRQYRSTGRSRGVGPAAEVKGELARSVKEVKQRGVWGSPLDGARALGLNVERPPFAE